jgi:hypothetical protein
MEDREQQWRMQTLANPESLKPAIEQLHHAAQFIALFNDSFLPKSPDNSHTTFGWHEQTQALVGKLIPFRLLVRMALGYEKFELSFLDVRYQVLYTFKLDHRSKREVLDWMREYITEFGGRADDLKSSMDYDLPHHPTESGGTFRAPARVELNELATIGPMRT